MFCIDFTNCLTIVIRQLKCNWNSICLPEKCNFVESIKTTSDFRLLTTCLNIDHISNFFSLTKAQSAGVVEFADCISAEVLAPALNECPGYDTESFDGEAQVLELWGIWDTPSMPLFPSQLWTRVVIPVRVQSMDQIELFNYLLDLKPFNCVQKWLILNWIINIR